MRYRRFFSVWLALAAAVAVVAGAALVLNSSSGHHQKLQDSKRPVVGPVKVGRSDSKPSNGVEPSWSFTHPMRVGEELPLSQATALMTYPVPEPDATLADSSNLTSAWVNTQLQAIDLVYGDGDILIMMSPATYADPTSDYTNFIASNNATASLSSVNGQPALVIAPDTDIKASNPAWVEFELNGTDINIESATESTTALLQVAQTMSCSACAQPARSSHGGRSLTESVVSGRVVSCAHRGDLTKCRVQDLANVLVVDPRGRVVAREDVTAGAFRVRVPPGRYRIGAFAPTAATLDVRRLRLSSVTVGGQHRSYVRLRIART